MSIFILILVFNWFSLGFNLFEKLTDVTFRKKTVLPQDCNIKASTQGTAFQLIRLQF